MEGFFGVEDCNDVIIESDASILGHLETSTISNVTFEHRCYCNVAIFGDRDFILSNYTFGSWFLVRVLESRCDFDDDTFEDRSTLSQLVGQGQRVWS